jgi:hypothetical protein
MPQQRGLRREIDRALRQTGNPDHASIVQQYVLILTLHVRRIHLRGLSRGVTEVMDHRIDENLEIGFGKIHKIALLNAADMVHKCTKYKLKFGFIFHEQAL